MLRYTTSVKPFIQVFYTAYKQLSERSWEFVKSQSLLQLIHAEYVWLQATQQKTSATENRWSTAQHRGHTSLHYCIFILHTGHGGFFRGGTKRRPSGQAPVMSQYPKLLQEEVLEKLLPLQLVLLLLIFSETAQLRTVIQVCLHLWPHPENQTSPFFPKVLFQTFLDGGCLQ